MHVADMLDAVVPVVEQLQRLGVRYYVGGSVASSAYGVARSTLDIDLVAELAPKHVAALIEALQHDFYISGPMILRAIEKESCFNVIHLPTACKIDVFVAKKGDYDRAAMARIRRDKIGDGNREIDVFLSSVEDIILNKLHWYKLGEEVSRRQWSDVIGVIKIQHDVLDRDYLKKWAAELTVSKLLERAFAESQV